MNRSEPSVVAVINAQSGTALDFPDGTPAQLLEQAFATEDLPIAVYSELPDRIEDRLNEQAAAGPDVLIVGGGDGTLRTAAAIAMRNDLVLGLLPLGTLNRFANDIAMPLDLQKAIDSLIVAIRQRNEQSVDVATVNGRLFLCNSFIGLPPRFSQGRSRLRGRPLLTRVRGYATLVRQILRRRHRLTLKIDDGQAPEVVRALSIAVSNNLYDESGALMFKRPVLDGGVMGLYISQHRSVGALGRKLLLTALGRWRRDNAFSYRSVTSLTIAGRETHFMVSNDGEVEKIESPLEFDIKPKALRFLMPVP